ncbi:MAG: hypothetical protein WCO61_06505 [Alphaproteobacteria bacterium]
MDLEPKTSPSTGVDETFPDFASGSDRTNVPRVLPVIVQPVVPETTGAIASQAIASVPRPSEGTIRVIDTAGLAEINFNFAPSDVHIAALDVDLVMVFSDSSKLILPNLAVGLLGANPPKLNFLGKAVAAQSVIAAISQVTLADATPSVHFSSSDFLPKKPSGPVKGEHENATGQDGIGSGDPPVPPQPIVSGGKYDNRANETQTKTGDFQSPPVREVTAGAVTSGSSNNAISNPSVVTPTKSIDENPTKSSFAFDATVTGQLFQTVGTAKSGNLIKGATGTGAADSNADYAVQNTKEVLTGSATGDEIWGEDPTDYPAGMAGRSLQITLPSSSVTVSKVVVTAPDGVKIIGAISKGGNDYQLDVGPGNTFTMKLVYKLPTETTTKDSDGFYTGFKYLFAFEFSGVNTKGEKGTVTASATVGIRDVTSAAEQIGLDPNTGKLMVSLSRDPTGNIVNAGDGNDTVHGAAGADCIDGGDGRDRVVYDLSSDAVSVNLATGTGAKGFARGDTYINIEDVIGSDYNDTLIGNSDDNLLSGGKGDDSLVGGAGRNTLVGSAGADTLDGTDGSFDLADYSASSTGVTVDLINGTGSGGDAAGDRLINIEAVIGTAQSDLLIAGVSGSSIFGGDGNDTIDAGGTSNSTLVGGGGDNRLDYSQSSVSVSVSLAAGQDSKGNQFSNFKNIGGSTHDDTLTGDNGDNIVSGSGGNDLLIMSGGNDTLDGGTGDSDTIDYSSYNGVGGLELTLKGSTIANLSLNADIKDKVVNVENVIGTKNDDRISGDSNANSLQGGDGADTLSGNDGDDSLSGGLGADCLSGGTGNDTLDGGAGDNIAHYTYLNSVGTYVLRVAGATAITSTIGNGEIDVLQNIENILGSGGNDCIIGDNAANSLFGGNGNDTFFGSGGGDYIDGGVGDDDLADFSQRLSFANDPNGALENSSVGISVDLDRNRGQRGDADGLKIYNIEHLIGSYGDDTLSGDSQKNRLNGGDGSDSLFGNSGDDSLYGGEGNDTLKGGTGDDYLDGGNGTSDSVDYSDTGANDERVTIAGSGTSFTLQGFAANPTFGTDSLVNIEKLTLTKNADYVSLGDATSNLTLIGQGGADTILSGSGNDLIDASASISTQAVNLSGGAGNDTIIGGAALQDIIDYSYLNNTSGSVVITSSGATAFAATAYGGDTGRDTISNIEIFVGSSGNDVMDMRNATGNLTLFGNLGNDSFRGGRGNDSIDGGEGSDWVDYAFTPGGQNVTLTLLDADTNKFQVRNLSSGTWVGTDQLINVESIKLTANGDSVDLGGAKGDLTLTSGGGADTITTGSGNDFIDASVSTAAVQLSGNSGDDTLLGGTLNDTLVGGSGNDSLVGGRGADSIDGGDGFDTAGFSSETINLNFTATDSKTITVSVPIAAGIGTETLLNIEAIIGGSGNDIFDMTNVTDSTVNMSLAGNAGNDTFKSGKGSDTLAGGIGDDLYYVDSGADSVLESASAGNDTIYATGNFNLATNGVNVEQLYHRDYNNNYLATAFTGTGNALDNLIAGGTGDDLLSGAGGNDTFLYTGGNDTIDGEGVSGTGTTGTRDLVDFSLVGTTTSTGVDLTQANRIDATQDASGNWLVNILKSAGALFSSVSLLNIENITGTSGKDIFRLNEGSRNLTIDGKDESDTLDYSALANGSSTTRVSVKLNGSAAGTAVLTGTSNRTDKIYNIENVIGGKGADTFIGDGNANLLMGREGNDSIDGGDGSDTADYSYITSGTNGITVQLNTTTAAVVSGVSGDQDTLKNIENIIGSVRNDRIFGDSKDNSIFGGDGNDTLSGDAGADVLDGGGNAVGSSDMVDFTYVVGKTLSITGSSTTWLASVLGTTDQDTLSNFEAITLGKGTNIVNLSGITYAVTVDGSQAGSNSIATGSGADSLLGGGGNDSFSGGSGNDTINGGIGFDQVSYEYLNAGSSGVTVTVNSDGTFNGSVSVGDIDTLANIEAIIGSKNNDSINLSAITDATRHMSIAAGDGNNTLIGGAGNDTLYATSGNNYFFGGGGNNSMAGGAGNDTYLSNSANDSIFDSGGINTLQTNAFQTINLNDTTAGTVGAMLKAVASPDTKWALQYVGTGDFTGIGDNTGNTITAGKNTDAVTSANSHYLIGGQGQDYLLGWYGNNTISGGKIAFNVDGSLQSYDGVGGADTLIAYGGGNNTFYVLHQGDQLTVDLQGAASFGNNTANTVLNSVNLQTSIGIRNIAYLGTGAFTAVGSGDNNSIAGGSNNDCLDGFSGNDTLTGDGGDDTIIGGLGNDTIDGGLGINTLDYGYANSVNITLSAATNTTYTANVTSIIGTTTSIETDTFTNIQIINGTAGNDTINALAATDAFTLNGLGGNNSIIGGSGNDSVYASTGSDTLAGGAGSDTIDGVSASSGVDVASYSYLTNGIALTLTTAATQSFTINSATGDIDRLVNINGLMGGAGNDTLTGSIRANYLGGGEGDDLLLNGSGTTTSGVGNDTLDGGTGFDTVDYSYLNATSSRLVASASGTTFSVTVINGATTVEIDTLLNSEAVIGTNNNDLLDLNNATSDLSLSGGIGGSDTLIGGSGNDTLMGASNNPNLIASVFNAFDTSSWTRNFSTATPTTQLGPTIAGSNPTNVYQLTDFGSNAHNIGTAFTATAGVTYQETFHVKKTGGDTWVQLLFSPTSGIGSPNWVNINLKDGSTGFALSGLQQADYAINDAGNDWWSISLTGSGTANGSLSVYLGMLSGNTNSRNPSYNASTPQTILLWGGAVMGDTSDSLNGGAGNDSLFGFLGNDTLVGGAGNDTLDGGMNSDLVDYSYAPGARLVAVASSQTAVVGLSNAFSLAVGLSGTDIDRLVNIETIRLGTGDNIVDLSALTSTAYGLTVDGSQAGTDSIRGGAGADSILGGVNGDTLAGGLGNDTLQGGTGNDIADYSYLTSTANTFTLTRTNDTSWSATAAVGSDVDSLQNIEAVKLGYGLNTVNLSGMTTTGAGVTIDGSLGALDTIVTGAGNDLIIGGAFNNTLNGGAGNNTIDGSLGATNSLVGGAGNDSIIGGAANNTINGGAGNNTIDGSRGAINSLNSLTGGAGDDWIIGGRGSNTLSGGAGNNTIDGSLGAINSLVGGSGNDSIWGSINADTIIDGGGADTLRGGDGNDIYITSSGNDTIVETVNGGIDTIQTTATNIVLGSIDTANGGSANNFIENLTYTGSSTFSGTGNELDNIITGGSNSDTLDGGAGNDTIVGGSTASSYSTMFPTVTNWTVAGSAATFVSTPVSSIAGLAGTWSGLGSTVGVLTQTGGSVAHGVFYVQSTPVGAWQAQTFVVKAADLNNPWIQVTGAYLNTAIFVNFNLATGKIGNSTGINPSDTIITSLGNDWYSISVAANSLSTNGGTFWVLALGTSDVNSRYPSVANTGQTIYFASSTVQTADFGNSLTGGVGNDSLYGGVAGDTLSGGIGNDTLDGGFGRDTADYSYINSNTDYTSGITVALNGTASISVVAKAGSDEDRLANIENVIGTKYADCLVGDANTNSLQGGDGADTLIGGLGLDTLDGGNAASGNSGIDWVDYSYVGNGNTLSLGINALLSGNGGTATVSAGVDVDTLVNIENIIGSQFADTITGDGMNNSLNGLAGNDSISGGTTTSGTGNDFLLGGLGSDTIIGGDGNDTMEGNGSGQADNAALDIVSYAYLTSANSGVSVTLNGTTASLATVTSVSVNGSVTTTITTETDRLINIEGLVGSTGNDTLIGDRFTNTLFGGAGNDFLLGGAGSNTLNGGTGADTVDYSAANNNITFNIASTGTVALSGTQSDGGSFSDSVISIEGIITGSGDDTVIGDNVANYFRGNGGNDYFDGGAGIDIADYSYATNNLSVTLNYLNSATLPITSTVSIGSLDVDTLINVEGIITGSGNDTITNPQLSWNSSLFFNYFSAYAGAGNDLLQIGYGNNQTIDGGDGIDTADFSRLSSYAVSVNLATNSFAGWNGTGVQTWSQAKIFNVEYVAGTGSVDILYGDSAANSINGMGSNDTISGGLGNDTLDGGAGSNAVDYSYLDNVSAQGISLSLNAPTINFTTGQTVNGVSDTDTLINFQGIVGTKFADTLVGNNTGGTFSGGAGDDSILGGTGNDTISGGTGNDTLDGGGGNNILDYGYLQTGQTVSITFTNATSWLGNVSGGVFTSETDTLNRFNNISMFGSSAVLNFNASSLTAAQTVSGGAGADTIIGGAGNDSFSVGWGGNDTLDGGLGSDTLNLSGVNNAIYGIEAVTMTGQTGTMKGFSSTSPFNSNSSTVNFTSFEYIWLSHTNSSLGNNNGYGISDRFIGSATTSNIYIQGWGGADTLDDGGGSAMTLDGNLDNDTYYIRSATTQINDPYFGGYGNFNTVNTTLTSIDLSSTQYGAGLIISNLNYLDSANSLYTEGATWGSSGWGTTIGSGNFTGIGNDLNNVITGGTGNNSLVGGAGADTLIGNNGNDVLRGGDVTTGTDSANRHVNVNVLSSWAHYNASVTASNITTLLAPDGSTGADVVSSAANTAWHGPYLNAAIAIGTTYQFQIYAHFAPTNSAQAIQVGTGNGLSASFIALNLTSGSSVSLNSSSNANSVTALANNWYLITITGVALSSGTASGQAYVNILDSDPGISTSGSSITNTLSTVGTGKSVVLWGGTFQALDGADSLFGGAGNDTISGGNGNDTMDGGTGTNDIADYSYLTTDVTLDLSKFNSTIAFQSVSIAAGDSDLVMNFEGLIGGAGNDSLAGDTVANYLGGGAGSDTIKGDLGNDTIDGGGGYGLDIADYSYTTQSLTIALKGSTIPLAVNAGAGDQDQLINIEGIIAGNGTNSLTGDAVDNFFRGGSGLDTIFADGGNDTIDGGAGTNSLDGGDGNDMLSFLSATSGVTVSLAAQNVTASMSGGGHTDTYVNFEGIIGSQFSDTFSGTAAAETFDGGLGNDSIVGGSGNNDWLSYASLSANAGVSVRLGTYNDTTLATGGAGTDTLNGTFVGVIGSQYSDTLTGTGANETFDGGSGTASDSITGGGGIDWLNYASLIGGQGVTLTLGNYSAIPTLLYTTGAGVDSVSGTFQGAIGSIYADSITGSTLNDTIFGGAGNDTINSGRGTDESLDGGAGFDFISFASATVGVNVSLANSVMNGGGYANLSFKNFEGIIGSNSGETFGGDSNANYIFGNAGHDSISGGLGSDTISGGVNNDTLDGNGSGFGDSAGTIDIVDYSYSTDALTLTLNGSTGAISITLRANDIDSITNFEGIIGSTVADSLTGDNLANYLDGGAGNDTLVSGGGADTLLGGAGNDMLRLDWSSISLSRLDGGAGSDTISFAGSASSGTLDGSAFSGLLSNAEWLDFSNTSGSVNLQLRGDDIQKILSGSSSTSANAGTLDLKFDMSGDSLTLVGNSLYSFWQTNDVNATTGKYSDGSTLSITSTTNNFLYVFDANHTTLLATVHYQV